MAFDVPADLTVAYSAKSTQELFSKNVFASLCDKTWQPEALTNHKVEIPAPVFVPATAYTRAASYKAAVVPTQTFISLLMDQHGEVSDQIDFLDEVDTPLNYLEKFRVSGTRRMAKYVDANMHTFLTGLTIATAQSVASTDTTTASNIFKFSSLRYGADVGKLVFNQISQFSDAMLGLGAVGGSGDSPTDFWCVMSIGLRRELANYLLASKYSLDPLTTDLLNRSGIFSSNQYGGRLFGVDLIAWPALTPPAAADEDALCYFGAKQAVAYAERPVFASIIGKSANQTAPTTALHQISTFGRVVVNSDLLYSGGVKTIA